MFRRRAAAAAGRALRSLLPATGETGACGSVHQSLEAAGGSGSAAAAFARWRHNWGAAARSAAASGCQAQGVPGSTPAAHIWRVHSWQQIRQQWNNHRGYQHFGGRGQQSYAVVYSRDARRRALRWLAVLGGGGAVVWVSSRQEVPYTHRTHAIIVSPETELDLGKQTYQQVLMEARREGTLLPARHLAVQAVRRVGTRVAQAACDGYGGGFQAHLAALQWEFAVVDSPQINAFVVPGGKVVVYTGLLRLVRSEAELAAVLAHESAHVVARHAAERITQMGALEVGRALAYWVFGLALPSGPLAAIFFLPNSRKAETEADVIGLQIMARACYDPQAMVSVFTKMAQAEAHEGGDRIPGFLRTHPHSGDRIKAIKKMLPTAEGLYETQGCGEGLEAFRRVVQRVGWQ